MKRLLLILAFLFPFCAYAQDIIIDERMTDIYFANGVLNTEYDAWRSSDLIYDATLKDIYNDDITAMKRETDYKLLYNYTYAIILPGLFDMLEAFTQRKSRINISGFPPSFATYARKRGV